MNLLMSHMTDFLNLEAYKKTEGNEAQAKKCLGLQMPKDGPSPKIYDLSVFLDSMVGVV